MNAAMTFCPEAVKYQAEHGGLSEEMLRTLATNPNTRLVPILVRCGNGRFTTPAQNVQWFMDIIARDGQDYVRDISIAGGW